MTNIEVMTVLAALVGVGYAAGRLGYMGGEFDRRLSALVIDITCPALILSSTMGGTLPDRQLILPLLAISFTTYAAFGIDDIPLVISQPLTMIGNTPCLPPCSSSAPACHSCPSVP